MYLKQLFKYWTYQVFSPGALLREKYNAFKALLRHDDTCLELIADIEEAFYGREQCDWARIEWLYNRLSISTRSMVEQLGLMSPARYLDLIDYYRKIDFYIRLALDLPKPAPAPPYVIPLSEAVDHPALVGGKAANLSRAARLSGIDTPDGAVVTVNAFHYYLEYNELRPVLDKSLRKLVLHEPEQIADQAAILQQHILEAELPDILVQDIEDAVEELAQGWGQDKVRFAVRSSALAEDGDISFAGQYSSMLNVPLEKVPLAYKRVVASKYTAKAITYRILNGYADQETPMAVLVMPMVQATSAGVVYTSDLSGTCEGSPDKLTIYAVPGQGSMLVDGSIRPDVVVCPHGEIDQPSPDWRPSEEGRYIEPQAAMRLARQSLAIERDFGKPQDVEWAADAEGSVFILQTRTLHGEAITTQPGEERCAPPLPDLPTLYQGGECASHGIAAGPLHNVTSVMEVGGIPEGAVLAVQTLSPALARVVGRVAAVVSRSGSRASHFASVAREFGLPVLVGVDDPFSLCAEGAMITVDAIRGMIYEGVDESIPRQEAPRLSPDQTPTGRRFQKVMGFISKLTLTDPESESFTPDRCKSLHDVIRFAHEKSVAEMFSLVGKAGRGLSQAKKLKTHLPITFYLLDLGGGLFSTVKERKEVTPDDINSQPLWAFWFGLSSKDVHWNQGLLHVDWEEMDRISAGIFKHDSRLLGSYAVMSKDYLHMMIRFGYHFSVLDALCGAEEKNNYINFRFKGGGAELTQRELRLEIISNVLTHFGFSVRIRGDLLDASCARDSEGVTQKRLATIGYLLARTRLMDMALRSREQVDETVKDILDHLQK